MTAALLLAAIITAEPAVSFRDSVAPLLTAKCIGCHSGDRTKADLDLTTRVGLLTGGGEGPAVVPGKPNESLLVTLTRDGKMPPKEPLSPAERELLARWVASGAAWEGPALRAPVREESRRAGADWWSLRPVVRPPLPAIPEGFPRPRTPVDGFVFARLAEAGLKPSPEADRRTLITRLTLDLTGLRPTPEEVDAFVIDTSADAYERLVERLLASPAYGERWARHWLDVVRFAESHGYEMNTLRPTAWPYRDWVIRAFNQDLPFARFVSEQLAADALPDGDPLCQAATGFIVAGPHDMVGNQSPEARLQQRQDDLADMVATTGATFLGLTVGCARCHDHKFDPITQKDYYGLQAVFAGVEHAERPFDTGDSEQRLRGVAELRRAIAAVESDIARREAKAAPLGNKPQPRRESVNPRQNVERFEAVAAKHVRFIVTATADGASPCLDELEVVDAEGTNVAREAKATASSLLPGYAIHKIEHINDGKYGNSQSWISNEPGRGWIRLDLSRPATIVQVTWGRDRDGAYKDRLAVEYRVEVSMDGERWDAVAGSWDRARSGQPADAETAKLLAHKKTLEARLAAAEKPPQAYLGKFRTPDPTHILKRGDPTQKLEPVGPASVAALGGHFAATAASPEPQRRRALADWLTDPKNPLPPRVMVNRVWHWHFGAGLVRTPSDFGFNGDRPSHPELLDWLAAEFLVSDGRLKPIHRLIVLSHTYRQASRLDPASAAIDAGNRLLWRYTPRRLEAEVLRDMLLQASGTLDRRMGGPGYHLWDYSGYVIVFTPKATLASDARRRMVYQFKPRLQQDPTFGTFDCPDATAAVPRRNVSTTALQALNLLNDPFIHDQAKQFAARLEREAGNDIPAQVGRAFRLAFGRDPTTAEADAATALVRGHGLTTLCRVLVNANEFVFVD